VCDYIAYCSKIFESYAEQTAGSLLLLMLLGNRLR